MKAFRQLAEGVLGPAVLVLTAGVTTFALEGPKPGDVPTATPVLWSQDSSSGRARPAMRSGRNLFLAPRRVRDVLETDSTQAGPGPSLPPPALVPVPPFPRGFLPPPPPLPGPLPAPPSDFQLAQPSRSMLPAVLGVVGGTDPQVILAEAGEVVVARVGDQTRWGTVVSAGEGAVVLRILQGRVTLRVDLEGVHPFR